MAHTLTFDRDDLAHFLSTCYSAAQSHPKYGSWAGQQRYDHGANDACASEMAGTQDLSDLASYVEHLEGRIWRNTHDYGDMRMRAATKRHHRYVQDLTEREQVRRSG
jgi:hypothetical protein